MLKGIIPVLLTPMMQNGKIDEKGKESLLGFILKHNIGGLWVMGSASEDNHIKRDEKIKDIKKTASFVDGRVSIIAGTGMTNINDIIQFIDELGDIKLAGIHVLFCDTELGEKRTISEIARLADKSFYPIWLYHNPWRGRLITTNIIAELRDHPNIHGMKVGGTNILSMIKALLQQTPDFQVIGATGSLFLTMMMLGTSAHTSSDASVFPEEFVKLHKLFVDGKFIEARELQLKLIKFSNSIPSQPDADNGEKAAEEKFILSLRGICSEYLNPAYRMLTDTEKQIIIKALKEYKFDWAQKIKL
jgi:dihydrodipicolinate synthase/N-acetylneuraminate lyase